MKKTLMLIAGIIGLFLCTSSFNTSGQGIMPGGIAPDFKFRNTDSSLSIRELRGNYVVVNFWKAGDPASRIDARQFQTLEQEEIKGIPVKQISVGTDDSESLFNAVIRQDGLNPALQYNVTGKARETLSNEFLLDKGVKSLLIGPEGTILMINPTLASLKSLLVSGNPQC